MYDHVWWCVMFTIDGRWFLMVFHHAVSWWFSPWHLEFQIQRNQGWHDQTQSKQHQKYLGIATFWVYIFPVLCVCKDVPCGCILSIYIINYYHIYILYYIQYIYIYTVIYVWMGFWPKNSGFSQIAFLYAENDCLNTSNAGVLLSDKTHEKKLVVNASPVQAGRCSLEKAGDFM